MGNISIVMKHMELSSPFKVGWENLKCLLKVDINADRH